ncbi:MAG: hypothetical protein Q8P92_02115 [Candidatus Daviesbacteria bacterium]|nr:hypothetical protein [Candidatus Daviesbacteria bacterium]
MFISIPKRDLLLLLVIPLTLVLIWFRNGLIIGGGEESLPFYNLKHTFEISTSIWVEYATGLPIIGWLPKAPLIYTASLLASIGIPPFILQMMTFYVLMVVGLFSLYYLILCFLQDREDKFTIALITAIYYLLNPFTFSQVWGRGISAQYFSFTLLPLTLLIYMKALENRKYWFGILIALISAIFAAAYQFLTFIIVQWAVLFAYSLYILISSRDKLKQLVFIVPFMLLSFTLWVIINSWWLIPLGYSATNVYSSGISGEAENLGTLIGVSRNYTPDIIIRLLQRTYFYDASAFSPIYLSIPFQLISWIPVIFIILALYKILKAKLRQFRFLVILLFLGLIISLGANPPFGSLFIEVFKKSSILQAFRNPFEKFGLVYALGYSAIFAYGLTSFFNNKFKSLGILFILGLTCGIFAWPMWTGRVVAAPDKKIGVLVPSAYQELNNWLNDKGDFRLIMTPLWGGDGAFYLWDGHRYQGSDPMIFIVNMGTISNSIKLPYYYDFIRGIHKYKERINVAPSLSLLRAKYLVDRKDATLISEAEKQHQKYLTKVIYPPTESIYNVCNDLYDNAGADKIAWIVCQVPPAYSNWQEIKYLHIKVRANESALLDVAVQDKKGIRIRWDGRMDKEYSTIGDSWTTLILPINYPTEYNYAIDFSAINSLEIKAHPIGNPLDTVWEVNLGEVRLDTGREEKTDAFDLVKSFGALDVYEPNYFVDPGEVNMLSNINFVEDFIELFNLVNEDREVLNQEGFLVYSQNPEKNSDQLVIKPTLKIKNYSKISNTRYWIQTKGEGEGLVLLSKTFDPQWKILKGVTPEKLSSNFFNNLNLLKDVSLSEDNHYIVNGYANLWKIDAGESDYAIVYKPRIIAEIGFTISKFSAIFILGIVAMLTFKNYVQRKF